MSRTKPYQPLILRILHGSIAVLILIALVTGVLIYNVYDGRFGVLSLPTVPRIMGIHKLFGRLFLLLIPVFALYSFHVGYKRLVQGDSIKKLAQVGKPIWWYSIHRIINTLLLLSAVLALVTGRQVDEVWLKAGDLNHIWYTLHLVSWIVMSSCLVLHLLMILKVGGIPLLLSMVDKNYHASDNPSVWFKKLKIWMHSTR